MGNTKSSPKVVKEKFMKNHTKKRGFQFGIGAGKGDEVLEGNVQIAWTSRTIKNYSRIPCDTTCQHCSEPPEPNDPRSASASHQLPSTPHQNVPDQTGENSLTL